MKKLSSFIATFSLLANSVFAPLSVLAEESPSPEPTQTPADITIAPSKSPSPAPISLPEVVTTNEATPTSTPTPIPEISALETIPTPIPTSAPETNNFSDLENIQTSETSATLVPTSEWTFEKVELNKEYESRGVKLTFTKLPENSGNIKIEEITLTPEQIKQTGSLSDKAYDITSDMADGSFTYNLTLPVPESAKDKNVDVKFAEDISEINSAQTVDNTIINTATSVSVSALDHFTIFVVTTPVQDPGGACIDVTGATSTDKCFNTIKAAINAAIAGDTINVAAGTYFENININKSVVLEGIGDTIIKPDVPSQPIITISTSGVSIKNIDIVGTDSNSHGIYVQGSGHNTILTNVSSTHNGGNGIEVSISGTLNDIKLNNCNLSYNNIGFRTGTSSGIKGLTLTDVIADYNQTAGLYFNGPITGLNLKGGSYSYNKGSSDPTNGVGIYATQFNNFDTSNQLSITLEDFSADNNTRGVILNKTYGPFSILNASVSNNSEEGITFAPGKDISSEIRLDNLIVNNNSLSNLWVISYGTFHISNLKISNSEFKDSKDNSSLGRGYGLWLDVFADSHLSGVEVKGNDFTGNNTGIYLNTRTSSGTLTNITIEENNIFGNTQAGVNNVSSTVVDATHNWWGHITGPSRTDVGSGDSVSANVTYQEWLCGPYPTNSNWVSEVGVCKLEAPTQTGYNINDGTTESEPRNPNQIACTGGYTNINGMSVHWTDMSNGDPLMKYIRQYSTNGVNWYGNEIYSKPYTNYRSFGSGIEGKYYSQVKAFYDVDNDNIYDTNEPISGWSNICSITFDKTTPTISNVNVDKTFVKAGDTVTITANVTDNGGVSAVSADFSYNENYTSRPTPTSVTMTKTSGNTYQVQYTVPSSWSDGTMYIKVAANDLTGSNLVRSTEYKTVLVDNTPPSTPQMLGFNNPTLSCGAITSANVVTVDWSDSTDDLGSGVKGYNYEINYPTTTGGRATYNAFFTISEYRGSLNEGLHQIKVQAVDNAGNVSAWTSLCNITSDTIAPDIQITAPTSTHLTGIVEIKGTVTDANPHHYWFVIENSLGLRIVNLGQINDSTSFTNKLLLTWDTNSLPDGQYTIKLEARDSADNKDSGSVQWLFVTVDNTKPTVDLQLNVNDQGFKAVFSEDVNAVDATNSANYFLKNWPTVENTSGDLSGDANIIYNSANKTATISLTHDNWHISPEQEWGVKNIHDLAGNLLSPYSEYSTPNENPEGSWVNPTEGGVVSGNVALNFKADDGSNGSGIKDITYKYKAVGEANFSNIIGNSWNTTGLTLDDYILRAIVTDNAGNVAGDKGEFDIKVGVAAVASNLRTSSPYPGEIVISWHTNHPTTSQVVYDTMPHFTADSSLQNYGYASSTGKDTNKVSDHSVTITGLQQGVPYYFRTLSEGSPVAISAESSFRTLTSAGAPGPSGNAGGGVSGITAPTLLPGQTQGLALAYTESENNNLQAALEEVAADNPDALGASQTPTPEVLGTETSTSNNTWKIISIIVAVVLVVGYGFYRLNKKAKFEIR